MKAKATIIGAFLVVAAAILVVARGHADRAQVSAAPSAPDSVSALIEISMVVSPDKQDWIAAAAKDFGRERSDVQLTIITLDSLEAADQILEERTRPTVWSPSDNISLDLFAAEWRAKHHAEPFAKDGVDAPQPLLISPLVVVMWADRAAALRPACGGDSPWDAIRRAVVSPRGWLAAGGDPDWGFVKLGHADPARSSSGLHALVLMTLEHHGKRQGLVAGDLLKPAYQVFIKEIERGVMRPAASATALMTDLVRFGPSRYDIGVAPESAVIAQLENAQRRWGSLQICYPRVTLLSEHPAVLLQADWVTGPQRLAGRDFINHLRSRSAQDRGLEMGFRPADPGVPLDPPEVRNPFYRLAALGVRTTMPTSAEAPPPELVRSLLMLWNRVARD